MKNLVLAVLLLEKGLKLYFSTFVVMFPFLLAYGGIKWGLIVCGLDGFPTEIIESSMPEKILLWGLTVIHLLVYFFFFTIAIIVAYQQFNAIQINIVRVIKISVSRYFQLLIGSLMSGLIIFYPVYMIEWLDYVRTGSSPNFLTAIFILVFCIILLNFTMPVVVANKNLTAIQGIKFSGSIVKHNWIATFALVVFWAAFIMIANWIVEEFDKAHSKAIISLVSFSLIPCLMVVLCDNFEKAAQAAKT